MEMNKSEATKFFAILLHGEHHFPRGGLKKFGPGWAMNYAADLATYDGNFLTRMVFLAHDHCLRASISQAGPGSVKLIVHKRKDRDGDNLWARHPSLEDAIETWRKEGWGTIEEPTENQPHLLDDKGD